MIRYESFLLKNIVTNKKKVFGSFKIFGEGRGWEGVGVILFNPITVSKHKIQLLTNKPCAILYLLKDRVTNLTPLNKFF